MEPIEEPCIAGCGRLAFPGSVCLVCAAVAPSEVERWEQAMLTDNPEEVEYAKNRLLLVVG